MKKFAVLLLIIATAIVAARGPQPAGLFEDNLSAMHQRIALKSLQSMVGDVTAYFDVEYGTPYYIEGNFGTATDNDHMKTALDFLSSNKALFRITTPQSEFYIWTLQYDEMGFVHLKLQQRLDGVRIKGKQLVFHFDSDNRLYCINGNYIRTPDISTSPVLSESQAEMRAREAFLQTTKAGIAWLKSELLILPDNGEAKLAWFFTIQGERIDEAFEIGICAQSGEILRKTTLIYTDGPVTGSGIGVNGASRTLNLYQIGSSYKCVDATKPMFGGTLYNGVIITKDMGHGELEVYADTVKPIVSSSSTTISDPAAVDAHYFHSAVYDFYRTALSWNSFDNAGHSIRAYVHMGTSYNNAFWSAAVTSFFYGDGNGVIFKPLSGGGDVVCHEFQHGVTTNTAGLEYRFQSGALNEAYSDIAASTFDRNWEIGEDIVGPGFGTSAMRFMNNPHACDPPMPAHMSEYNNLPESMDQGGVHINCSIPSLAFVRMVDSYLNRDRGWEIWFRALRYYLTETSDFTAGAVNVRRAAQDLYGSAGDWSNIETAICNGFRDVGLDAGCGGTPPPTYDGDFLYLYNEDAVDIHPFYMPDTHYFDQYACAARFTPPSIPGLKVVAIHIGIAYCWTMSDMDMYLGTTYSSGGEIYPNMAIALSTIPNVELWRAVSETSYVVSALFDEAITTDFFAVAHCPDSDPYWPNYDFVLTAVDDASTSHGDGNRNITTDDEGEWVTMDYWWGDDYNFLMAASITYPGADVPELIFPNCPITFAIKSPSPNPFNSAVAIDFSTPFEDAKLEVFDLLGRKVTTLADGGMTPGNNRIVWNGADSDGNPVASGTYLIKLSRGQWNQTRKVTFVK
jgi:Zn-dependent metalloprotease